MVGRRRPVGRRRARPRAKQVKVPTNMYVADTTFDMSSKSALENTQFTIFDNSGTAGNKTVVFTKLTVSWGWEGTDNIPLLLAVMRRNQSTSAALDLDDADAIRDAINQNQMLRGPWMIPTSPLDTGFARWKTMVFKKLMLDSNDDLQLEVTPMSATAAAQKIHLYYKGFYRIVD